MQKKIKLHELLILNLWKSQLANTWSLCGEFCYRENFCFLLIPSKRNMFTNRYTLYHVLMRRKHIATKNTSILLLYYWHKRRIHDKMSHYVSRESTIFVFACSQQREPVFCLSHSILIKFIYLWLVLHSLTLRWFLFSSLLSCKLFPLERARRNDYANERFKSVVYNVKKPFFFVVQQIFFLS